MVQRESRPFNLQGERQQRQVSQAAPGPARPDPNVDGGTFTPPRIRVSDGRNELLQGLLGNAQQLFDRETDRRLEEEYLRGASAVAQGMAEEEIEGNPLTRRWAVAGYRDTAGRLKIAQAEAELASEMQMLREQSPEEFQKHLAARRPELMQITQGMSFEQRKATVGKLIMNDVTATQEHKAEHAKFIIDTERKSLTTSIGEKMQRLTDARMSGDHEYYNTVQDAVIGTVAADVWANDRLPAETKISMTGEVMEYALASDNLPLYDYLAKVQLPFPGMGERTALSILDLDDQISLSNKRREAGNRTAFKANLEFHQQIANVEAGMQTGTYDWTYDQLDNFLVEGVRRGAVTESQYRGLLRKHLEYQGSNRDKHLHAAYGQQNNVTALRRAGVSDEQAAESYVQIALNEGEELHDVVGGLLVGRMNGNLAYGVKAGELIAPSFMQLDRPDGTVDQDHADMIQRTFHVLEQAEQEGHDTIFNSILEGMPDKTRDRALMLRDLVREGHTFDSAVREMHTAESAFKGMSPQQRAAFAQDRQREHRQFVEEMEPRGALRSVGLFFGQFVSADQAAKRGVTQWRGWMRNEEALNEAAEAVKAGMSQELNTISRTNPWLSQSAQRSKALARVSERTINTDYGPLVLPMGANAQSVLGGNPNDGKEILGDAVSSVIRDSLADYQNVDAVHLSFSNNQLSFHARDEDGMMVHPGVVDPQAVGAMLGAMKERGIKEADREVGAGVTVRSGGHELRFNGENTAGVDPSWMLKYRHSLVQHESIRDEPYPDGSGGRMSVGVGVNSGNPDFYPEIGEDGKITPEQIRESFLGASNFAADRGWDIARSAGIAHEAGFRLAAELAYQAGPWHIDTKKNGPTYVAMYASIRDGDPIQAKKHFRDTPAYSMSNAERRQHYLTLITMAATR